MITDDPSDVLTTAERGMVTAWTKACANSTCIEVTHDEAWPGGILIRSASTVRHREVRATAEEWWQFLDGVKAGAFDHVIPRERP
jgi:hypothetical protein